MNTHRIWGLSTISGYCTKQLIEYPLTNCLYNVEQMETWQVSHVREHVCSFNIPYNADVPKFVSSSHCVEVQHTASCHKPTHV